MRASYAGRPSDAGGPQHSFAADSAEEAILNIFMQLLKETRCPDVNLRDVDGRSALSHAAFCGHRKCVELLLDQPLIEINLPDDEGMTPLMWASSEDHYSTVDILLKHGATTNCRSSDGYNAFVYASPKTRALMFMQRTTAWMTEAVCWGSNFLPQGELSKQFFFSSLEKHPDQLNRRHMGMEDKCGNTFLAYACSKGKLLHVQAFFKRTPADVHKKYINQRNQRGISPIILAARSKEENRGESLKIISLLIKNGAEPGSIMEAAVHAAAVKNINLLAVLLGSPWVKKVIMSSDPTTNAP